MIRTLRTLGGLWILLLSLCVLQPSVAAVIPAPSAGDPRIRQIAYDPNEVVLLEGRLGYAMTIEFQAGETIENVSIGDSLGWQVTPNRRANLLFIKPIEKSSATNMTVVTNLRAYNFDLRVHRPTKLPDTGAIFILRFLFPEVAHASLMKAEEPPPSAPPPPTDRNHAYAFQGAMGGLPTRVFDDGVSTYFTFPKDAELPAIYAVDDDKKEAVLNVILRDDVVIVDRVARGFVLRRGTEVTRIFNNGFRPNPGPASVLPRQSGAKEGRP